MHLVSELPKHPLDDLLMGHLPALLGDIDQATLDLLRQSLQWVELPAGQTLMRQGEPGDAMYLLLRGRLRTYIAEAQGSGEQRMVREITRGQVVGEISLYTNEPRSATLVAARDSVLVRLGRAEFEQLLTNNKHASLVLTRQIIQRLRTENSAVAHQLSATIALLPISAGVNLSALAATLAGHLSIGSRVATVAQPVTDAELEEIEASHDYVLLLADSGPSRWTESCARHCDELLLIADAAQVPALHPTEHALLQRRPASTGAHETLLLLHAKAAASPRVVRAWLACRPTRFHLELQIGLDRDIAKLAERINRHTQGNSNSPLLPSTWRFGASGDMGRFELQLRERRLLDRGIEVPLGTRALDLLQALLERPGRLVTKGELLDRVWPGLVVEENNISVQIATLRRVLGRELIGTVAGHGYRFEARLE
ncbi:cyclic nucleotide-binding domain-containing protein [Roseateles oligotrophus]|uniref:Cyclic nucleotide-binding domain-containing protein n=1 Tax=Roseateles oligotrophus TaxID=1769250 RepID=A0ABT2YE33_9BURK|nr:cyclic nucleotide-binding domain-containing protein [Roseateles oligotrophus]MCV2368313.1 cyclic nucleotide-binding domain-containing protein [Roseateles oligotrophus]